jgi:asparagine synthetase B (glutamine-hydrolysing)
VSFASELKALLRMPGFSREVDLDALDAFLAFGFVPAPLTIFREARKLPPGSVLWPHSARGGSGGGSAASARQSRSARFRHGIDLSRNERTR